MKKILTVLTIAVSVLVAGQQLVLAQQRQEAPPRIAAEERQAQTQVQGAESKINANRKIVTQIADLAKKNDRDGVRRLLIANGAPPYTQISGLSPGAPTAERIRIDCKFTSPPPTLSCTISW